LINIFTHATDFLLQQLAAFRSLALRVGTAEAKAHIKERYVDWLSSRGRTTNLSVR